MDISAASSYVSGSLSCLVGAVLYALGMASAQALEGFIPDIELNAFRFLPPVLVNGLILAVQRQSPFIDRWSGGWILLKAALGGMATLSIYAAAPLLPVSLILGLQSTLMIVYGSIQQTVSDRACKVSVLCGLVLCTARVTLITQPTFLGFPTEPFSNRSSQPVCFAVNTSAVISTDLPLTNNSKSFPLMSLETEDNSPMKGYTYTCISVLPLLLSYVIVNKSLQYISPNTVSFWTGVFNSIVASLLMLMLEQPILPNKPACWGLLLCHGWTIGIGGVMFVWSAQLIPPVAVCILRTLMIAFLAIFQYTFLRRYQPGHRNWEEILGICLVIVGNIIPSGMDWWKANGANNMDDSENVELNEDSRLVSWKWQSKKALAK